MAKQTEHDFEALLAWNLFQIGPALCRYLIVALRKSRIENAKMNFAEKLVIGSLYGWCSRGDGFSVDAEEEQFGPVDMYNGVERIEHERVIIHCYSAENIRI